MKKALAGILAGALFLTALACPALAAGTDRTPVVLVVAADRSGYGAPEACTAVDGMLKDWYKFPAYEVKSVTAPQPPLGWKKGNPVLMKEDLAAMARSNGAEIAIGVEILRARSVVTGGSALVDEAVRESSELSLRVLWIAGEGAGQAAASRYRMEEPRAGSALAELAEEIMTAVRPQLPR